MKQVALTLLAGLIALHACGKKRNERRPGGAPPIYITTSTGFNNNTAIMGFNFELPVRNKIGIDAGVGTGTWNNKLYIGAKYYLEPAQRGFAFGGGLTYATGTHDHFYTVTSIYGKESVEQFNKNPQTNIFLAAYKYWSMGKKYNRFYAELGWSVPVSGGDKFTQLTGDPIDEQSERYFNFDAPGGLIAAAGFSFGIGGGYRKVQEKEEGEGMSRREADKEIAVAKHHLYADIGISGARLAPGLSLTYNYRLVKWIGLGAGFQVYDFFPTAVNVYKFVPALYGELRFNILPRKKNQFFIFLDLGSDFYKHSGESSAKGTVIYTDTDDNGFYNGWGLGYFHRKTNRNDGFYTSLKLIFNDYEADAYDFATHEQYVAAGGRGTIVLSFGYKF